ncbi:pentatricopeptide repeat-containing protein At3g23020 [Phalaenopsis equestris]|uniref:pentatricopeptide repeat-containing protein At3g23020 n=1 Tax=Phalaenopsis equestris TaxID=78828 RepID=UPI0009E39932|nr:pentatricopeptide repeat-containing protein At3g23020 [Phalaenopsis equestris]
MLYSYKCCCNLPSLQLDGAKCLSESRQVLSIDFTSKKSKKQHFVVNLSRESNQNNGVSSKLNLAGSSLLDKIEAKCPAKFSSYGGCIPSILQALEDVKDIDEALKPWERNLNNKERTIILKEQTNWQRAWEIFNWFKSKGCYELNVIHYNIVLRSLGMAQKWSLLWSLWNEMQCEGIIPTNATYGTLINAYSRGGLKREALMWLGEMYKQGVKPDEVTMGTVVQAYKKAGEFCRAEDFFKRWSMAMGYATQAQNSYGLYTYNTLIDTYGKAGLLREASDTFAQMLSQGIVPDTVTFNTMIHICGSHERFEEVLSLVKMMEEVRCYPDTRTYNILISLYVKHDNIAQAIDYFKKMKEADLVPDIVSYRTLLYALSVRCMVEEVESLVMEMEINELEIDEYTQTALTRMYVKLGKLEQSWTWFEKFLDKMSSECFAANIDAFGELGMVFLSEKAFSSCAERRKLSVVVFNVMIKAYGVRKEYDKACDLFNIMDDYGILPDKCTYGSIIQLLSDAELPHKAAIFVRRMQEADLVRDCVPYSMVISSFTKLGEVRKAEDLFKEMIKFGLQPDIIIFSVLINAFAEVGSAQEAVTYLELMKSVGLVPNSIICNSLIKLYTKIGFLREAEEIYELAKSCAGGPHQYSSNCMIHLYCDNAMVEEAEETFHYLKLSGETNEFSYAMMLCLYKKMGRFDEAYKVAQEMHDLGFISDALSYNNLIGFYAADGRMKEALKTFQQMLAKGIKPDDAIFRSLGIIMLKRGASKEAIKRLKKVRERDALGGLQEWVKAMCSMVMLDETFNGHNVEEKGQRKGDFSIANFYEGIGSYRESMYLKQYSCG